MHFKGAVGERRFHSNGDFTEGFKIGEPKGDSEWIELTEIYPLVFKAVKSGIIKPAVIKDSGGNVYKLSKPECEIIVSSYLEEVFGFLQGLSGDKQLKLLKDKHVSELLTVPLTKGQVNSLKQKRKK